MALFFADLVREASWGEGGGDLALGGALPGHQRFADAVPAEARFHYAIAGVTHPDEWETGEGEIVDGKLVRAPFSSSAGGAAVELSAGLKTVALTVNAGWFDAHDEPGTGDVFGLSDALADKAPLVHAHGFASLTGKPATLAGYGITDAAAAGHDHGASYQPLDADLSAIAALATTGFGRGHLTLADAAALRAHAGLGSMAVQAAGSVAITGGAIGGLSSLSVGGAVTAGFGGLGVFAGDYLYRTATNADFTLYGGSAGGGGAFVRAYGNAHATKADMVEIATAGGAIAASFASGGAMSLAGVLFVAGSQVVAARRTGWTAPSGTPARSSFDTASVTTEGLAQRVKALIDDLAAHGLIGS